MEAWRKDLYLAHHGILGQKWGIRRFQNKDGTLTEEGKRRYKIDEHGHYVDLTKKKFDRTKNPLADAKQMSDEDLKRARDRATMENTYADQMRKQHVETLPEKIKKTINETMTKTINDAINTGITRLGNKITNKILESVGLGEPKKDSGNNQNQNQQQSKKKEERQPESKKKEEQQPESKKKEDQPNQQQNSNDPKMFGDRVDQNATRIDRGSDTDEHRQSGSSYDRDTSKGGSSPLSKSSESKARLFPERDKEDKYRQTGDNSRAKLDTGNARIPYGDVSASDRHANDVAYQKMKRDYRTSSENKSNYDDGRARLFRANQNESNYIPSSWVRKQLGSNTDSRGSGNSKDTQDSEAKDTEKIKKKKKK